MNEEKNTIDVSYLIGLINEALTEGKKVADQIARATAGREVALTITKLEEARHWAVDAMMLLQPPIETANEEGTNDATTAKETSETQESGPGHQLDQ